MHKALVPLMLALILTLASAAEQTTRLWTPTPQSLTTWSPKRPSRPTTSPPPLKRG